MSDIICKCGNAARYVDSQGELCCSLCPLKAGRDAVKITAIPELLQLVRRMARMHPTSFGAEIRSLIGRIPSVKHMCDCSYVRLSDQEGYRNYCTDCGRQAF